MAPVLFDVVGTWWKIDGTPCKGNIVISPRRMREGLTAGIIADRSLVVTLVDGAISTSLVANTDGYKIIENVDGADEVIYDIPGNLAGPLNLKDYGPPAVPLVGGSVNLDDAVILAPATSVRNVIQSTAVDATPLTLKAFAGQTASVFDVKDALNADVVTVASALNNVWRLDGNGAGAPIVADAGTQTLSVRSAFVAITVGDSQATIQASFNAAIGAGKVVISGNWSLFTMTFPFPYAVALSGAGFTLGGNPVNPVLTEVSAGRANGAELVGTLTVSPNTGAVGDPGLNVTKYDGSGVISHLDDDGGFVLGNITASEDGNLAVDNQTASAGGPIFQMKNFGATLFQVLSPGAGFNILAQSHDAADRVLVLFAWTGQTAAMLEVHDENDNTVARITPNGTVISNAHAEPADGDLNNSDFGLWLDDTPGASKLHAKWKEADGTVRTATWNHD